MLIKSIWMTLELNRPLRLDILYVYKSLFNNLLFLFTGKGEQSTAVHPYRKFIAVVTELQSQFGGALIVKAGDVITRLGYFHALIGPVNNTLLIIREPNVADYNDIKATTRDFIAALIGTLQVCNKNEGSKKVFSHSMREILDQTRLTERRVLYYLSH